MPFVVNLSRSCVSQLSRGRHCEPRAAFIAILKPRERRLLAGSPRLKQNKGADQQTSRKGAETQGGDRNDTHENAKPRLVLVVCHVLDLSRHRHCPARALFSRLQLYPNHGQGEAFTSVAMP